MVTRQSQRRLEEGGGLRLDRGFQAGGGDAVARGAVGVGRNDVEQVRGNTGIGQVRGDAGAHGARAQDGDFINPFLHGCSSAPTSCRREFVPDDRLR